MTPLQKEIAEGEKILTEQKNKLDLLQYNRGNTENIVKMLVEDYKSRCEERISSVSARLESLRTKRIAELEAQSAECNARLDFILKEAATWKGKEPKAITEAMEIACGLFEPYMDQEKKNELYFAVKGHLKFLNDTYQDK